MWPSPVIRCEHNRRISKRDIIVLLLVALACSLWFWAGYRAGRAKYDELKSIGCTLIVDQPITKI